MSSSLICTHCVEAIEETKMFRNPAKRCFYHLICLYKEYQHEMENAAPIVERTLKECAPMFDHLLNSEKVFRSIQKEYYKPGEKDETFLEQYNEIAENHANLLEKFNKQMKDCVERAGKTTLISCNGAWRKKVMPNSEKILEETFVVIEGLPAKPRTKELLLQIVEKVCERMYLTLDEGDVVDIMMLNVAKLPILVIQFKTVEMKEIFLSHKKSLKCHSLTKKLELLDIQSSTVLMLLQGYKILK